MKCTTLERYDENGIRVDKQKKQYDSLDEAIRMAKIENSKDDRIHKVVAYKCNICFKYHIGRNGTILKDKEREKNKAELKQENDKIKNFWKNPKAVVKIVGFVEI
jgi:hypothetical protein